MIVTMFLLGVLFLALAMHPFVTYPLSLLMIGTAPGYRASDGGSKAKTRRTFAICMCAYNEEAVIAAKISNLLQLQERHPGLELLVYVDCASDRTAETLSRYTDKITLIVSGTRRGKTYGMNQLVALAESEILVFTDANVMLDMQVLDRLNAHFMDPLVGCVSGTLIYTNAEASLTASTGALYWRLEEFIKRLEQRTGSVMGADGSLFAIRSALHKPPPEHIIDDMYVSFMVLFSGYRIVQAADAYAYEESSTSAKEEFQRKVRIACQAFNVHRLIWRECVRLDALSLYKYISHKLLRWLTIYLVALSFICFLSAMVLSGSYLAALLFAVVPAVMFALGRRWRIPLVSQLGELLLAFIGVGIGVWRSLRGDAYQTWTSAASARK